MFQKKKNQLVIIQYYLLMNLIKEMNLLKLFKIITKKKLLMMKTLQEIWNNINNWTNNFLMKKLQKCKKKKTYNLKIEFNQYILIIYYILYFFLKYYNIIN